MRYIAAVEYTSQIFEIFLHMIAMLVLVARQWRRYLFARTDASFLPCAPLLLLLSSARRPLTKRSDSGSSCPPSSQAMLQQPLKSAIVGFHEDELGDWVAELQCGHNQHVRHNPPWCQRPWVLTQEGRRTFLGYELSCPKCLRNEASDNSTQNR
jgi:Protein of unknown function (DUF3565)